MHGFVGVKGILSIIARMRLEACNMQAKAIAKLGDIFDPIHTVTSSGVLDFDMLLEGKWVSLSQRIEVRTPINDNLIATIPSAATTDADRAVNSSYANRNSIRTIPAVEKIEIFQRARELLLRNLDSFSRVLTLEAGKPKSNADGEVKATAERLKLTPDEYGKIRGEHIPGDWSEETVGTSADVLRELLSPNRP